jgi:hypothetical protein
MLVTSVPHTKTAIGQLMMAPQRRALRFSITLPISQAGDLGVGWDGGQCVPMQIFFNFL